MKSHTAQLYESRTAETLCESAKILRDAFCREYIKDFNGRKAMSRLGFAHTDTLRQRASQFLREPYVQQQLDKLLRQLRPEDVVTRGQVMAAMWKEANDYGNEGGVRVSALAHLARMLGMDKGKEEKSSETPIGVMLVPVISIDEWSTSAAAAQALLKQQAMAAVGTPQSARLVQAQVTGQN